MNPDDMAVVRTVYDDDAIEKTLCSLASRWRDEHAYEDIGDYAAVVRPMVEAKGAKLVAMRKRPFGMVVKCGTAVGTIMIRATNGTYCFKYTR